MNKNKDILNNKHRNPHGFKVPDGYFDSVDERLFHKLEADKDRLPKHIKTGFTVPKGYFEQELADLKFSKQEDKNRIFQLFNKKIIGLSIAASFLIFLGIKTLTKEMPTSGFNDLSSEELLSWLETDASDVNSYDIAEVFDNLSLDEEYYSDEAILDYVADSNIEELLIEN